MSKLRINLACWDYDRTRALLDGRIAPNGVDLNYLAMGPEETFFRMLKHEEFDASEMSLSSYTLSLQEERRRFIAIPAFPSRIFRHSCIYVSAKSGIQSPADLVGKRVGCPEYQMTATVWIRGMLADHYGVPVDSVEYRTGGLEEAGRAEKIKLKLPANIKVTPIAEDRTLSEMLGSGEIDALYTARAPSTYTDGSQRVRRLFEDYPAEEARYYGLTSIFPIMHTMVLRREVYEANRWLARSMFDALNESKRIAQEQLHEDAALKIMLPNLPGVLANTMATMGEDFWPYGVDANQNTLRTFLRYAREQGLLHVPLEPADLFAPETLEAARI
jgi:4,5-dihydroxyphthalate decarboxylase